MKKITLATTGSLLTVLALAGCSTSATLDTSSATTAVSAPTASISTVDTSGNAVTCEGKISASPSVTEGPYYKAGDFVRSDISEGQAGLPMTLTLTVVDTNCNPVPNARVDIWHANAQGQYSGVTDPKEGCADCGDKTFLRGTQTTSEQGQVTFQTIFPGWYPGRTVHIHVKIWENGSEVLTTQLFVTKADADTAFATAGYKGEQNTTNEQDRIAQQLGSQISNLMFTNNFRGSTVSSQAQIVLP
ncbi:intradiol ring-cleavage dioxygenase [Aurantimicrobium sp. MWH-Uga1]|uniref:intradiol ring-cleavage dioxygenase n=1 Tax=Aurantimicrobium sp. MWH-Uga1 TaxID=2079575 RepID=UPI000DF04462|nr:intradiol ring-cleavage dioxygenase [Aurantimicrobium sp. MWH-Uga1]AXE54836.1 Catechol 1,2-dioxygenase [Aurantimicrobium sp. MWH-Uga1]